MIFSNKLTHAIAAVYFIMLAAIQLIVMNMPESSGYVKYYGFRLGLLAVLGSGFLVILVKPHLGRIITCFRFGTVLCLPFVVIFAVSTFLWCLHLTKFEIILRGSYQYLLEVNQILTFLYAAVFLYCFGEKGVLYYFIAVVLAFFFLDVRVIMHYGIGAFLNEFCVLLLSFADQAGPVMLEAEFHELAFITGAYYIYLFYDLKKHIRSCPAVLPALILSLFSFTAALKRIGVLAILVMLLVGMVLKYMTVQAKEKTIWQVLMIGMAIMTVSIVAYVAAVRFGLFDFLEKIGIDSKDRKIFYDYVKPYYTFSPFYTGFGVGYVFDIMKKGHDAELLYSTMLHNDFLQFYIDLGFWGFLLWMASMVQLRVAGIYRISGIGAAIRAFMLTGYLVIVSSTDNTMNYTFIYVVMDLLFMGYQFDQVSQKAEETFFEKVRKQNDYELD